MDELDHDRVLAETRAGAAAALSWAQRLTCFARSPWSGAVLVAAHRLSAELRWYDQDVKRRDLDQALRTETSRG
jgi:hypothetical protein